MKSMLQHLRELPVTKMLEESVGHWVESLHAPHAVASDDPESLSTLQRVNSARALHRAAQLRETLQGMSHANQDMQAALRRYKLRREHFDESPQLPVSAMAPIDWDST